MVLEHSVRPSSLKSQNSPDVSAICLELVFNIAVHLDLGVVYVCHPPSGIRVPAFLAQDGQFNRDHNLRRTIFYR